MTPVRIHAAFFPAHKESLIAAADWVLIELRLSVKVITLTLVFRLQDEPGCRHLLARGLNELAVSSFVREEIPDKLKAGAGARSSQLSACCLRGGDQYERAPATFWSRRWRNAAERSLRSMSLS